MNSLGSITTRSIIFEDEFDHGIDSTTWVYDLGNGTDRGIPGWGNGELQTYTTANSFTENGSLIIEAREETLDNRAYTSARMTTRGTVSIETGLLEVTAKMPEGKGLWPAIWLLGDNHFQVDWPDTGEIDIAEIKGSEPSVVHTTAHWSNFDGSHAYRGEETETGQSLADGFHVYGLEKTSTGLSWLLDGEVIYTQNLDTYPGGSEFSEPFYLLLNLAVGGQWWDGNPDDTTIFPARMEIDSVKISSLEYQMNLFSTSVADGSLVGTKDADRFTITLGKALISAEGAADQIILEPIGQWEEFYVAQHNDYQGIPIGQQVSITGKNQFSATIDGGDGIDSLTLSEGDDAFFYHDAFTDHHSALLTTVDHDGRTTVARVSNVELIEASNGDDIVDLTSPIFSMKGSQVTVIGGNGNDILWGNDGDDLLKGDAGDDQLAAGAGYNILSGGVGADHFQFTATPSINWVTDFNHDHNDKITFFLREDQEASSDILSLTNATSFQTDVLGFDSGTVLSSGGGVGVSLNPDGPAGSNGNVLAISRPTSAQIYSYVTIKTLDGPSEFIAGDDKTLSLKVWSPVDGTRILLKLEETNNQSNPIQLERATSVSNAWETLSWDFSDIQIPDANYIRAVLFIDGGVQATNEHTYYFDDFTYQTIDELPLGEYILNEIGETLSLSSQQRAKISEFNDSAFRLENSFVMVDQIDGSEINLSDIQTEII